MLPISHYPILARQLFKDFYGKPFILTKGQEDIFVSICNPKLKRVVIKASTQYGKSEVASMALILAMIERPEKVLLIAPSKKQATIIMNKLISHLFDHEYLTKMIEYGGRIENLKHERSKHRLTIKNGSEVMILTAEASHVNKEAKNLMGFGATIVLVDESSLIPKELFSKILRMVGGVKDGKLIQLGNPFERNHFADAFKKDRYHKISIDYIQALAEGRLSQDFIDEAKEDMSSLDFKIFYECEFPDWGKDNLVIPENWINLAINQDIPKDEDTIMGGLDVARFGNDSSVLAIRVGGHVTLHVQNKMDTMALVGWASDLIDEHDVETTHVDAIGIGSGVYDRLDELGYDVEEVNVGSSPHDTEDRDRFFNLRAQLFWNLRKVFKPGRDGKSSISIPNDKELINELKAITYKYSSEKKIKIDSKDEMKKILRRSPDKADALSLVFSNLTADSVDLIIM